MIIMQPIYGSYVSIQAPKKVRKQKEVSMSIKERITFHYDGKTLTVKIGDEESSWTCDSFRKAVEELKQLEKQI